MAVKTKSTELTTSGFASLEGYQNFRSSLEEDCQGLDFTLDRIKIPSGGSTNFELPGEDDNDTISSKEVVGVMLYNHPAYGYYKEKYTGGNNPPDCGSFDGITGNGNPGGACASCPYNQFGSGDGQAKACKNRRYVYILQEGEVLPLILSLPTGSLKEFTNYMKRQISKGRKPSQIVTKITLRKTTNSSGIAFSQAVFSFVRVLEPNEKEAMAYMTDQMKAYAANLSVDVMVADAEYDNVDPETGEIKPI